MPARTLLLALLTGAALACGSTYSAPASPQLGPGFYVTIAGSSFSPLDLRVPPGATVTVLNADGMLHSVTSQATASAFVPGSVGGVAFDTGQFTGTKTFAIPGTAASGTVIPYYCSSHLGTMVTPNGTITVDPAATPAAPPGGGGGGGY